MCLLMFHTVLIILRHLWIHIGLFRVVTCIKSTMSNKFSLKLLQIFGFFPLSGISDSSHTFLKFSWLSFKFIYSLVCFLFLFLYLLTVAYSTFFVYGSLGETTNLVFYISGVLSNLLFFKLARDWPQLMCEWHEVEILMGTIGINSNLKRKLKVLTTTFLLIATVEHILIQCYQFIQLIKTADTVGNVLRKFYTLQYFHTFYFTDYALWKALVVHIITIRSTFSWTYVDVFVTLMSTAFVFRLKQFSAKIEILLKVQAKNLHLWKKMRIEHYRLYRLCGHLDEKLAYIIMVSYGTNLYFILVQLFGSMRPWHVSLRKIYYCMSFGLVVMRMLTVTLYGSSINSESKKVLHLLLSVPSASYNKEIERLIDQVIKNKIVISGKNFFNITKGLILQIAGAVVTYELVLTQFYSSLLVDGNEEQGSTYSNSTNT